MITQLDCSEVHVNDDTITAQTWLQAQLPFPDRSIQGRQEYNAYNCARSNTLSYLMNSRLTARDQTAPDDKQHLLQPPGQEWPTRELVN